MPIIEFIIVDIDNDGELREPADWKEDLPQTCSGEEQRMLRRLNQGGFLRKGNLGNF